MASTPEVERSEGMTDWSSGQAIGDPRAYLQARLTIFVRVLCLFFAGFNALILALFTKIMPDKVTDPGRIGPIVAVPALYGAAWLYLRGGVRTAAVLRALEIVVTFLPAAMFGTLPLLDPTAESSTVGVFHLVSVIGLLVTLRAAVVPSAPVTTLLVSASCVMPAMVTGYVLGNIGVGFAFADAPWSRSTMNVIAVGVPVLGCVVGATIVSKIVHGLERKVRQAMQLGQYTLEEKIGEGGMGVVYKARHALLRRPTAIKLLPPDRGGEQAIARFEREVHNTCRLTHPNTVAIYDFGRTPDGVFYYAMEYLDGLSLDAIVQVDGPQPAARVIHVLAQVAEALAEAHGLGLVHRDIKPANIVLCERGGVPDVVKVLDFGLVKDVAAPGDVALTAAATLTGTPLYLAPEALVDPNLVDGRTDLYALGAVGYHLLSGEPVFAGSSMVEVCSHHIHTAPMPPSERLGSGIDEDLEALVLRCLAKKPAERPRSAAELSAALRACRSAGGWLPSDARAWWSTHAPAIAEHRKTVLTESSKPTKVTVMMGALR